MEEEEIGDILDSHQTCFVQHGTLCATAKAEIGAYQNGSGETIHTMKDYILHINAQGIAILVVDDINGAPQEHTLLSLPHEDIVSTTIKIKLLHFLFTIEIRKGTIVYKLHKNVLVSPWHKENLFFLLLNPPSAQEKGGSMRVGAIFDMNDLLFDMELVYNREWCYIVELCGLKADPTMLDELRGTNGTRVSETVNTYWPRVDAKKLTNELFAHVVVTLSKQVPMKPGVVEPLEYLKQHAVRTTMASSASMGLIKNNLCLAGIANYFGAVVSGEQVECGRSFPDIFLLAAQKLNLQVQDCHAFEDGINGVRVGIQAGCSTIMAPDLAPPIKELYEQYTSIYLSLHAILHALQTHACQDTVCLSYSFQRRLQRLITRLVQNI